MARNVCNCIYFHIQEKTSKCVILHACYWDVLGFNCNWGGGGGGGALDVLKTCG